MGYDNPETGPAGRAFSALRQYGLITEPEPGRWRVSDNCFRYFELPEGSPERLSILREAGRSPALFKDLLGRYKDVLPSDASLRSDLVLEKGFNTNTVADFIKVFRATINLAKLLEGGYTPTDAGNKTEPENKPAGGKPVQEPNLRSATAAELGQIFKSNAFVNAPAQAKEFRLNTTRNSEAQIVFVGPVTQEGIEKLKLFLELQKDTFPTQAELERPRSAIWRNKDHDQPVTITGELGEQNGQRFYAAKETSTGIPEDELEFEDAQAKGAA
jgi:hypothetical protein